MIYIIYASISLLSLFEIQFLANIAPPPFRQHAHEFFSRIPERNILLAVFFFILLYYCLKKQTLFLREKPSILYLLLHSFLVIFIIASRFDTCIARSIVDLRLFPIFLISFHYTLILSFFSFRDTYLAYLVSFASTRLLSLKEWGFQFKFLVWLVGTVAFNAAKVVYLLLRISGFHAVYGRAQWIAAIIGTDRFKVDVYLSCSGVEGISMFLGSLLMVVYLKWEKINKGKAFVVGMTGALTMHFVNIFRIYLLILIGHFSGSETAIHLWHSHGSAIFYAVAIVLILKSGYQWMVNNSRSSAWSH